MSKYIIIEKGSRGEVEDVEVVSSELSIREFCDELYKKVVKKLMEEVEGVESEEEMNEYLGEFGGVSKEDGYWEVVWSEENWYEVYEIIS